MRMNRRTFLRSSAVAAAGLALPSAFAGRARAAGTALTLQAAWINDAEFLGYFVAIDEGLYTKEGIELTYLSGGPDVIPESSLLTARPTSR